MTRTPHLRPTPSDASTSDAEGPVVTDPKILVAGDTHGDMEQVHYLLAMAKREGCGRVVQVGDFGYWPHMRAFDQHVAEAASEAGVMWFWLDGNHENFDALERAVDVNAAEPQRMAEWLWYLPRGCTWEWDGVRFMALGGAYSIDKAYRVEGRSWWRQELLTREQVERAMDRGQVDILFTHDAPEGACPIVTNEYKGDEISRGNRKAVTAVMDAVIPKIVIHGHYHHRYSVTLQDGPQVVGLGRDGEGPDSWITLRLADWRHPLTVAS